jgi:hypothetical protein
MAFGAAKRKVDNHTTAIMAVNRKVDTTTTQPPSLRPIEKLIKLPHDRHHGGQ